MRRSPLRGIATLVPVALVAVGGPALAHVTVNPDTAAGGGYTKISFRVPTESDTASTTRLQVYFPADHPFGSVSVQPVPGWSAKVVDERLKKPITTDDDQVTQAVSRIIWTATSRATAIRPGQFQEFSVSLGPLPDSGSIVFKVLQTYSDGKVARWIDPTTPGQGEPEHPAPTLTLTPAGESTTAAADGSPDSGDSRSTWALGLSGLAVLVAAGGAVLGRRKAS